jgi:hypothetical protein
MLDLLCKKHSQVGLRMLFPKDSSAKQGDLRSSMSDGFVTIPCKLAYEEI